MNSERKDLPTPDDERRQGKLWVDAEGVTTLVRICRGVVAVRRVGGQVVARALPHPAPKPAPRGERGARVLRLRLPAPLGN